MRRVPVVVALVTGAWVGGSSGPAGAQTQALDTAAIERLTGVQGRLDAKEGVFLVSVPRGDLQARPVGVRLTPSEGLTSWVSFKRSRRQVIVRGDLVLMEDQVNPVLSAALDAGLEVTGLHNHFFWDAPKLMLMQVAGAEAETEAAASAVAKVLSRMKETAGGRGVRRVTTGPAEPSLERAVAAVLEHAGALQEGVYKVVVARPGHGSEAEPATGVRTWAAFTGSEARAVVAGDIALLEKDLQGVLKTLRAGGINVVAIDQHMAGEEPRTLFVHYWGTGTAGELARTLKAAFSQTGAAAGAGQ